MLLTGGRVGGLLRLVPGVVRDEEDEVGLVAEEPTVPVGRLVVVVGLLGGTVSFLVAADPASSLTASSGASVVPSRPLTGSCSTCGSSPGKRSADGAVSTSVMTRSDRGGILEV